ncbi:LADA_0G08944g1_1 [Lachancea dasiensis]|uniref:LADA_0G08944g1_1 n=1 Tax=Lachancea dasiensis TaxID=1072105 RepID=A0A1G4JUC4_9SACH|nr:LADA_0G08944g1_1 [Lachancea dasiensis]
MSLISAAADIDDTSSIASAGSTKAPQAYRRDGKALSKEAIYRAKQKYGMYQSPARTTGSGVSDAKYASDVAANLANNNKTTIEAYKRLMVDSNASKAATAVSSRSRASSVSSNVTVVSDKRSTSAATKALAAKPVEAPITSGKREMDMAKILSGAEAAAGKRMDMRSNPEKVVYVGSKDSVKAADRSFSFTPEIMERISTKNQLEAEAELEADPKNYASRAAYAVRDFDPNAVSESELLEREKKKQAYFGLLTSPQVLALAKSNAQNQLASIDRAAPGSLFRNEEFNKLAVALAQKSSSQRSENKGKINMGGGLWLSQSDVQNIAQGLITPVLDEVDSRALQQRAVDEDIKQRKIDYKEQNSAWAELQRNKIANDKMFSRETRLRHARETEGLHTRTERKYQELLTTKDAQVADVEKALQDTKDKFAALQKLVEQELLDEEKRCETELAHLAQVQEDAIVAARKEQDLEVQPYLDDVIAAEAEHQRLVNERETLSQAISDLRTSIENHKIKIEQLDQELVDSDAKHEEEGVKLDGLATERDEFEDKIESHYVILVEKAKEQAQQSSEESRLRQLEVDTMINERQSELNATELRLKNEKLVLLEAMRSVTQLKGEEKLDEGKVKALLGMTSDEFIAQQQKPTETIAEAEDGLEDGKFDKTEEPSVSTESLKNVNGVLDSDGEANRAPAPKVSTSKPVGAKPSMVDAVLPPDFKPEVKPKTPKKANPTTSSSKKGEVASPTSPKGSSLKKKLFGIVQKDNAKSPVKGSSEPVAKPAGKPVSKPPKAKSASQKPEPTEKIQSEGKVEELDVEKPEVKEPEIKEPEIKEPEIKEPEIKAPEIKAPEVKEPEVKETEVENIEATSKAAEAESPPLKPESVDLKPTFSGFSQANQIKIVDNSDDEVDELPDSSEVGENNAAEESGDKKGSLFKEVF